jgi:hypothetical protein
MKEMESRIIYHIEKFIYYLLGGENENDREQRIYNKLLRLEGDKLEIWMNEKFKKYIIAKKYNFELMEDEFEGFYGPMIFRSWYYSHLYCESDELMNMEDIYGEFNEEYKNIISKIQNFQEKVVYYNQQLDWKMAIILDYIEMYIMTMNSSDLKTYIIKLVGPIK